MPNLRLNPAVLLSFSGESCLAYNVETNHLHRLNPMAALLVELCDGSRDRAAVLSAMTPLLGQKDHPACLAWMSQAVAENLLCPEGAPPATDLTPAWLAERAQQLRYQDRVLAAYICQQRATELDPDDPDQWYALAELAHILGRRDESRRAYERYHQARPQDVEIEHLLVALRDDPPPARASNEYIEQLYSHFAGFYDQNLYLEDVARESGLKLVSQSEQILRYEYGQPVNGWVTLLRAS